MKFNLFTISLIVLVSFACTPPQILQKKEKPTQDTTQVVIQKPEIYRPKNIQESLDLFLKSEKIRSSYKHLHPYLKVQSLSVDSSSQKIVIDFNQYFSYIPFREKNTSEFYQTLNSLLPDSLKGWNIQIRSIGFPIEELIPNAYRTILNVDSTRFYVHPSPTQIALVRKAVSDYSITNGLANRYIAMWHSHGWYYNNDEDRWMWQRARLFGTVEDLYPLSFVIPYIAPMLERAGAITFMPRERDIQTHEVIVDNNSSDGKSRYQEIGAWKTTKEKGFAIGKRPYKGSTNPFRTGSAREISGDLKGSAQIVWIPDIPETGDYAVYVSYIASADNTQDAEYTVHHSGGKETFYVNQQMSGSTWVYLGTFHFKKGLNSKTQKVTLTNRVSRKGEKVSADAVRFGGGMGVIERNGRVSERPKYTEGARYWLQYAGFPDSLTYQLNENNDYNDDYQSRSEWVNFLVGAPFGPNKNREIKGLGIPIDASLAFHTDAGITGDESTVGTLMIYSIEDFDSSKTFPNGVSRLANRDLADLMQTEIVEDIRDLFDSTWARRNLYNRQYSEAYRANVPSILLELLSHQNFADMKLGHEPEFKFHVSRAIYKSLLKFISYQNGYDYVVQPLPVTHMNVKLSDLGNFIVNWSPQSDPLEPSAEPDAYILYIRKDDNGFDEGRLVKDVQFEFKNPKPGVIYSFKVEAVNKGGRSMPSEIVSAALGKKGKSPVLVINGFTRLSAPASISIGNFEGFLHHLDHGVSYGYDVSFVGEQYNFDKTSRWITDDEPGHGASYANHETSVIAGNTFDFAYIHGRAILDAGYSFFSSSLQAVMDNHVDITAYKYVDLILGEQKKTRRYKAGNYPKEAIDFETFPIRLQSKLKFYAQSGGNIFVSGAYVTTDSYRNFTPDSASIALLEDVLHVKHRTDHASKRGEVVATYPKEFKLPQQFRFNTDLRADIYQVEAPDAIIPSNESGKIIARFKENGFSAATAFEGYYKTVVFGFPFETILDESDRKEVMKAILTFFDQTID